MTNAHPDDRVELHIAEPCSKSWDELTGDDARRYCSKCELHVIHGSALTRDEAIRLVQGSSERVCMSFEVGENGALRFRPEPRAAVTPLVRNSLWRASASAAVLAACARTDPSALEIGLPNVPETAIVIEQRLELEPTVLDALPPREQERVPVAPVAEPTRQVPNCGNETPRPVARRFMGAVATRRVTPPVTPPK